MDSNDVTPVEVNHVIGITQRAQDRAYAKVNEEMAAEIYAFFQEGVPPFGTKNLWFL